MTTTLQQFKTLPRLSVKTAVGWIANVIHNAPSRRFSAEIIYTTREGKHVVFEKAQSRVSKQDAVSRAWDAALVEYNKED